MEEKQIDIKWKAGREALPVWKQTQDGTDWLLEYPTLAQTGIVEHCFTTRRGGVSEGIFSTLNVSFTRGDEEAAVRENYRRIAKALHTTPERFVLSHQTHTTNVRIVTNADAGKGIVLPRDYEDVDGLVTNVPELVLSTFYADCVPLFFVDTVHRAIGLSHSGWRGTVKRMGQETLRVMAEAYGTQPQDVICAIGPSICKDCYEVSADVAEEFIQAFGENATQLLEEKKNAKYQLDLWEANRQVLLDAGVLPQNISVTSVCTCCNDKLLFSHRATNGKRGNLGAFLYLKKGCE